MKINIVPLTQSLSFLGFVLSFYVFLLYHLGIYNGYWINFLQSYFGFCIGLFFIFYFLFFPKIYKPIFSLGSAFLFPLFFIFSYSLLVTILNFENTYTFYQSLEYLIMFFTLFIMGFYLISLNNSSSSYLYLYLLLLVFFLILNSSLFQGRFSISILNEESASGYQTIARNFLAFFLLGYCYLYKSKINLIYFFIMVFSLFLIGARSEFVIFLAVSLLVFVLEAFKNKTINYLFIFPFLIIIFFLFSTASIDSRQLQLLDVESSSSWEARNFLTDKAIQTIIDNWFFGDFGSHLEGDENVGRYSHNLLSGYVNYGLIYFVVYLYLLIFISLKSFIMYWNYPNWLTRYSFMLNLICSILLIFAKPIFWPLTYLAWGVFSGMYYVTKVNTKNI